MTAKENTAYNEGWEDCLQHFQKDFVPAKEVVQSIDKLLDKINKLKVFLLHIENHYIKLIDIEGKKMPDLKSKNKNMKAILKLIEEQRKLEI